MFSFFIGSTILTYLIAKLFLNTLGALFSVLCYVSISNIVVHGASFRYDPSGSLLFLMAVYLLLKKPIRNINIFISGLGIAVSMMITLKTFFFLITLFVLILCIIYISENKKEALKVSIYFYLSFVSSLIILFMLHKHILLGTQTNGALVYALETIQYHKSLKILFESYFHNIGYIVLFIIENIFIVAIFLVGLIIILHELIINKKVNNNLLILSFLINITPVIYYRYNFPYFYLFILSPAIIMCGVLIDRLEEIYFNSKYMPILIYALSLCVFLGFIYHYKNNAFDQNVSQKQIVKIVHKIFPKPVPYIDRGSMISSFPSVGLKMGTHDMERYLKANNPIMRDLIVQQKPVFIVANVVYLDLKLPYSRNAEDIFINYPLLEKDYEVLRKNYIHHWGKLYVSGKHFIFNSRKKEEKFEMLIPGTYTIEATEDTQINGVKYKNGDLIRLYNTIYVIKPIKIPSEVTIRWGDNLYKPDYGASSQPIFFAFYPFYSKDKSKLKSP
jgi:hypothetical protein